VIKVPDPGGFQRIVISSLPTRNYVGYWRFDDLPIRVPQGNINRKREELADVLISRRIDTSLDGIQRRYSLE
jgi:hypothetical protein